MVLRLLVPVACWGPRLRPERERSPHLRHPADRPPHMAPLVMKRRKAREDGAVLLLPMDRRPGSSEGRTSQQAGSLGWGGAAAIPGVRGLLGPNAIHKSIVFIGNQSRVNDRGFLLATRVVGLESWVFICIYSNWQNSVSLEVKASL